MSIKGHPGQLRMHWIEGLTVTLEGDGNTLLNGPVVDQSALYATLKQILLILPKLLRQIPIK